MHNKQKSIKSYKSWKAKLLNDFSVKRISSSIKRNNFLWRSKQAICLLMILSILSISTPAAPQLVSSGIIGIKQNSLLIFGITDWLSLFSWGSSSDSHIQETQEDRDARVSKIEINSAGATFLLGKQISLIAFSYDYNDTSVAGVKFEWEVEDENGNSQEISDDIFTPKATGLYKVTARGAGNEAVTTFQIKSPEEGLQLSSRTSKDSEQLLPPYTEWDNTNIPHARNVSNLRGNNPGKPKGRTNFNISAPVFSMPGRGMDLNLGLFYNSQVWSKLDQNISYDMDKDWLAPGWNIGFGKIINIIGGGIVQVDADGTRRYYSGELDPQADKIIYTGQSTDGTFIKSKTETSAVTQNGVTCFYNPISFLKYPDGTTIKYEAFDYIGCYPASDPITMVPTRIQDRHGNQIDITYYDPSANAPGVWIKKIRDTLGREYTFNYTLDNGRNYLTSITGNSLPDENQVLTTRTFVRLQYKSHTVAHNFTGLTAHVRQANIKVLSAIYYPSTQSGYWFGDSASYSPYGMIGRVDEQKAMSYSPSTGISPGTLTRRKTYSYPTSTTTAINDIPSFYDVTESWEGMTTAAPTTEFQIDWNASPRTTTTISANQSKVVEYSYNYSTLADTHPDKAKDGLAFKTEYYDTSGQVIRAKDEIEWELGYQVNPLLTNSKIPRPTKITKTVYDNGTAFTKTLSNTFGTEYNQVVASIETGYAGPADVLRKSTTEYIKKGDSPVSGDDWQALPRLINLPTIVEVKDKNNNRVAYTKYEYDLNALQSFSGTNPPNFCISFYCNNITDKGNLSKTTTYENITNSTLSGALSNNVVYDKAGNVVEYKPEVSANTLNTYKFTNNTRYAYPEEIVTGSDNPLFSNISVKSTATYNFETGLTKTVTDSNLQTVNIIRDINNWRVKQTLMPTGAYTSFNYDDATRTYSQATFTAANSPAGKQVNKINGLGLVYRQESYAKTENNQEVWNVVETEYDQFGRTKRASNPFRSNESTHGVYWTEVFYDAAGRAERTVSPDGSEKFDYFNETARPQGASSDPGMTYRMKDPIGREKWYRTDSDGNIAEVIEPDPNGTGSVATNGLKTKYSYDSLNRLLLTEQLSPQGTQIRKFKYDSLGRVTNQKMAETKATLADDGTFVGDGNGQWSDFYTYDKLSNVVSYKDARGVSTNYSYTNPSSPTVPIDPLNRIFSISYNTNGAADVLPSPTINYAYETSGNISRLKSVTGAGVSTVNLGYDALGRINEKKTTLANRSAFPMVVNYSYDTLNRLTDVTYPEQYGSGITRKNIHYDFDAAGRGIGLKVNNSNYVSDLAFNNFNQVTSVKIGPSGSNQITETYNYNQQNGFLENQKVLKSGAALLDLSYEYQQCGCSGGGPGQITKIINNIDPNRNRAYEYDTLARLKKVTGGLNKSWSQSYSYDRFGNRTGVSKLGVEAFQDENSQSSNKSQQNEQVIKSLQLTKLPNSDEILSKVQDLSRVRDNDQDTNTPLSLYKDTENLEPSNEGESLNQDKKALTDETNKDLQSSALPTNYVPFDFDNDGKADYSVWQRETGTWAVTKSGNNQTTSVQFGSNGDQIAPGDYDGDGKTDYAIWRPSTGDWYINYSSNGTTSIIHWGAAGDSIVPADYDGDNKTDIVVWRPSTGTWYILRSSDGGWSASQFGAQQFGDIPVSADYDGDGKADISVWRPSSGTWYIYQSSNGQVASPSLGASGDVPVSADYDGDGKSDLAVWRPSTGVWYIYKSSNGQVTETQFGGLQFGDIPVAADYGGDGKADIAVWRPSSGSWYVINSSTGTVSISQLGASGNVAVPSAYRRRSSAPKNQNQEIPRDGIEAVTYDYASNRITNSGFIYDLAGNQTQVVKPGGTILKFQYDAAGRMVKVKNSSNQTIVTHTYDASRMRLITQEGNESSTNLTYYAWEGGSVIAEYAEAAGNVLVWMKNYVYMGGALLATHDKTTSGEKTQFNHSDSLGTRMVTDPGSGTYFEQNTLPFGNALDSESSGSTNRRFTSYDRSASTGLDYAANRFYDSSQGRFTTVDPIKMSATSLANPQTLNLYAYTANDPVNRTDPDGLDWRTGNYTHRLINRYGNPYTGSGRSINTALARFFQGVFGSMFGSSDYAGRIVAALYNNPSHNLSATERYGLPNSGETSAVFSQKEQLSDCVRKLLQAEFPNYSVNGEGVNIVDDARFIKGMHPVIQSIQKIGRDFGYKMPDPANAMTLGIYNIYYGPSLSLIQPTWDNIKTIIEELVHAEQFINHWINMPDIRSNNHLGGTTTSRPTYEQAQRSWAVSYLLASKAATDAGLDSYKDNSYESSAHKRRDDILNALIKQFPKEFLNKTSLCP